MSDKFNEYQKLTIKSPGNLLNVEYIDLDKSRLNAFYNDGKLSKTSLVLNPEYLCEDREHSTVIATYDSGVVIEFEVCSDGVINVKSENSSYFINDDGLMEFVIKDEQNNG